jgi:hypothetical protein
MAGYVEGSCLGPEGVLSDYCLPLSSLIRVFFHFWFGESVTHEGKTELFIVDV